jgi:hypothetical protein
MPNYEDLRIYFDEQTDLRQIVDRAARIPIVTGFTIDIDPLWAWLHDLYVGLANPSDPVLRRHPYTVTSVQRSNIRLPAFEGYRRRDLMRDPPNWSQIRERWKNEFKKDRLPVILTIVHRPISPPIKSGLREIDEQDALNQLMTVVNESRVAVHVEERPRAQFAFAAGDGISTSGGKAGVLGGVLKAPGAGKFFGMTCAHVVGKNDKVSDTSGVHVGNCIADTPRSSLISGSVCDPVNLPVPNPYPGNGPSVNMLDCALVDVGAGVAAGTLAGIAGALSPGQSVAMKGAHSNMRCKLGSLALSYVFRENQQDFCFRDTIELLPQPWGPFGGILGQFTTTMPSQGDSGAWVLTSDDSPLWAALFFGEDGHRGFAIRSSWAHSWAELVIGAPLSV